MARCSGTKPDGTPCERIVGASQSYCYSHDPSNAEARQRNAARGGKSTNAPRRELKEIKAQVRELVAEVRAGRIDKGDAAVMGQLLNVALRALSVERAWYEADELEARLNAIEVDTQAERLAGSAETWR